MNLPRIFRVFFFFFYPLDRLFLYWQRAIITGVAWREGRARVQPQSEPGELTPSLAFGGARCSGKGQEEHALPTHSPLLTILRSFLASKGP